MELFVVNQAHYQFAKQHSTYLYVIKHALFGQIERKPLTVLSFENHRQLVFRITGLKMACHLSTCREKAFTGTDEG